jgi:SAM-dependent methyltransferase
VSDTYGDVDASAAPGEAVAWQEQVSGWPSVQAYKRRTYELVTGADRILDIGCGPGADVVQLGRQRCTGIDRSATMTAIAAARGAVVCRADAHRLPIADGAVTAVRTDRVLQHLSEPPVALAELVRVLAPGGRLVVAEPDQESLVIHVPGVRRRVVDRLKALRRDVGYRSGRFASQLPERLARLGLGDVGVEAFPLLITDPSAAFGLPGWPARWRREGPFDAGELAEWDAAMRNGLTAGFVYVVTVFVVSGDRSRSRGAH